MHSPRVRFAPSPTGFLHFGGARTALFNWLLARKTGGKFILRVEDTDDARNTQEATQGILDGMRWLGLDWDEGPDVGGDFGPYFQSQRKDIYARYLAQLEAAGRTYTEENGAVRFKFSRTPISWNDMVCGEISFPATEEPDMTLRRPDGGYIFHFVNVVDDIEMGMTHVLRGEDHISNTWKHIDLFRAFGKPEPRYGHIPLILNPNGSKMSKRDEGAHISEYQREGFLPDAVFNYCCLLGWTPRAEAEKLNRTQLVELFDPEEIHKSNAKFDMQKCLWFNAQYLRAMPPEQLFSYAKPFLEEKGLHCADQVMAARAVHSVKEKISKLSELPEWVHYFFRENYPYEDEVMAKLRAKAENSVILAAVAEQLTLATEWTEVALQAHIETAAKQQGVKAGGVMPLLRFALSGQARGPGVTTILELIGKAASIARLQRTIALL
jgi:glutamyl-tRNA synthetase